MFQKELFPITNISSHKETLQPSAYVNIYKHISLLSEAEFPIIRQPLECFCSPPSPEGRSQ